MMRKFRLFGVLLLVLVLFPVRSYAVDFWPNGSYWNGITSPGYYAALVRADDIYGAAAYGLNKDPASLSSDVRLKLSDPNYGGKFYEYAHTFYNVEGWPNMPEWVPTYVLATSVGLGQSFERVYASEVTTTLRDEALRDFERVLAGEDLSGGSSSHSWPDGDYYKIPISPSSFTGAPIPDSTAGNYLRNLEYVYVNVDSYEALMSWASSRYGGGYSLWIMHRGSRDNTVSRLFTLTKGYWLVSNYNYRYNCEVGFTHNGGMSNYEDSCIIWWTAGTLIQAWYNTSSNGDGYWYPVYQMQKLDPTGCPVVHLPESGWPESEPTPTPTAPEIPTPTAPTDTPNPTPTEPTVVWPTAPIVVNPPEVTVEVTPSGLDYTELLTRINDNLNELNSYVQAINGSLNSLRSDIIGGFDDVVTSLRNIYQYLQHLNDILELHCKHLRDALDDGIYNLELYIKSLFEWLPQQLDFDANFDYDDSGIKSYLQRILNKIPGGATGTPQTYMPNPQADEPGFLDWLLDLWHRFLIDLVSVLPDELGGLVDAFSQLTHYFPFSIPWDLAALLALFEHEPVTPVFDVPWGFGGGDGEIEMVRVDLSAWDGVMEMVRPVFLVGFCWQLAMITKDLLANFDINKGGV